MTVYDASGRELLTVREVMARYGVRDGTLRARARAGTLTRVEQGGRYYYLATELATLTPLKAGRVPLRSRRVARREYVGGNGRQVAIRFGGRQTPLHKRRDLLDYSTRYAWDAAGSLPDRMQLSVAILADAMGGAVGPLPQFDDLVHSFEREVVSRLSETFELPVQEVRAWLSKG